MKPEYIGEKDWELAIQKYSTEYVLKKLKENYPIQYLIGNVNFCGYQIDVNESVLIPRFETELLVDKIITMFNGKKKIDILEIGTGSGCVSVVLKKKLSCNITATDISDDALVVARNNSKMNEVDISFVKHDILKDNIVHKYDLIVSNPPYVSFEDYVDPQTKFEPEMAIYAQDNGLLFYKEIIKKSVNQLKSNGVLAFEIGANQADEISKIIKKYYKDSIVKIENDFCNRNRYVFVLNKNH